MYTYADTEVHVVIWCALKDKMVSFLAKEI